MRLLPFGSDDGCGNHHWGERILKPSMGITREIIMAGGEIVTRLKMSQKGVRRCQHEGCSASKRDDRVISTKLEDTVFGDVTTAGALDELVESIRDEEADDDE